MSFDYYLHDYSLEDNSKNLSYFFESDSINEEIYYINDYKPMDNMQQKSESNLHILSEKGNNTKEIKLEKYQNNEHNNLLKTKEFKKGTNALGRKTKDSELKMIVNKSLKYRGLEKVKNIILKNLLNFINDKIKEIYDSNIGQSILTKKLLSIKQKQKQKQKSGSTDNFNKEFLDKSIGNIFSEDIRTNYSLYLPSHNKRLIELLLNEEDNNKRIYFNKLFNLTFRDALKYFRGSEDIEELNGMERFGSKNKDIKNDENYLITLKYYVINFEEILGRKRNKKKDNQ